MGFYLTSDDVEFGTPKTAYPLSAKDVSGHRFYQPETGRWQARDPMGDHGSLAVRWLVDQKKKLQGRVIPREYLFVNNQLPDKCDMLGLTMLDNIIGISWQDFIDSIRHIYIDPIRLNNLIPGSTPEQRCCVRRVTGGQGLGTILLIHHQATSVAADIAPELHRMFPNETENGLRNAFRHCYAACMLSAVFGRATAWDIEECHEDPSGRTRPSQRTDPDDHSDARNNAIGNGYGIQRPSPGPGECGDRCLNGIRNGDLDLNGAG